MDKLARILSPSARLALQHMQDGDTWIELTERIPRIEDGSKRHYHHCIPPLITLGLIERAGSRQLPGRAIRDDSYSLTPRGKQLREFLLREQPE